jgi:type IV secretory pathway VirB2 component (pilin)
LAAILGLVIGLGFFWVLTRSLSWKEILIMVAIVIALHAPVLVNEWQTGGESIHSLTQAKEKKLSQEKGHAIHEMIFRAYQENSSFAWLVLTGQQNTDTILTRGLKLKCDKKCEAALPYSLVAMLLFGYVLFASYRSGRLSDDTTRKRAIVFVGCWLGGFFIITIFLAYQLQTRFYLGVAVPIFIALGLAAEYLYTFNDNTWLKRIFVVLGIFIILLNITATGSFLRQLTHSQVSGEESGRDLRFGTEPKVTLGQLREIAKDARDQFSPNVPMIIFGESHYVKALYYVMSREQGFTGCYVKGGVSDIPEGYNQLFLMENKTDLDDKREDIKTFGTLASTVMRGGMYQSVQPLPQDCLDY